MPIIGLTDRGASFPRIGELRKGGEKPKTGNKPGPDLQHFRFTSQHADVVQKFVAAYGQTPTSVNVYLPFATATANFEAWWEEWGAGSLKWRGDGKTLVLWQKPDGTYSTQPKPQPAGGKEVGRFKVIIPELQRLAYVVALTTSVHDIANLSQNLDAYEAMRGDLRGIPFVLSRVPSMIPSPTKEGTRVRRETWLWHLEAQPAWVQAQLSVMQRQALPTAATLQLTDGLPVDAVEFDFDDESEAEPPTAQPEPPPPTVAKPPARKQPTAAAKPVRKTRMNYLHVLGTTLYASQWDTYRNNIVQKVTDKKETSSAKLSDEQLEAAITLLEGKRNDVSGNNAVMNRHLEMLYHDLGDIGLLIDTLTDEANGVYEPLLVIKAFDKMGNDPAKLNLAVEAYKEALANMNGTKETEPAEVGF